MSTKKVLLISEKQIKELSIVEHNVDSKLLSKVIQTVQETQLKAVLGADLYNTLLEEVYKVATEEGYALSAANKTLLDDYVKPFMVYATLVDFIVLNSYRISNKGLMKPTDNSATGANTNDVEYLKNYYDNYLSTYKSNLVQYLKDNKLVDSKEVDTNITAQAIGWYLDLN